MSVPIRLLFSVCFAFLDGKVTVKKFRSGSNKAGPGSVNAGPGSENAGPRKQ